MSNLFNFDKLEYIKGKKKKDVGCILCAINDKNPDIENLEIYRSKFNIVCVNLYPYNSGHLIIFPQRHIIDIREMTDEEAMDLEILTRIVLDIMDKYYKPSGFNIGYNIRNNSGASICHIHRHIVPRYPNEIGFIDIIGGAKIIIEEPHKTMKKFRKAFKEVNFDNYINKDK